MLPENHVSATYDVYKVKQPEKLSAFPSLTTVLTGEHPSTVQPVESTEEPIVPEREKPPVVIETEKPTY